MNVDEVPGSLEELRAAGVARVPAVITADGRVAHGWNPPAYAELLGIDYRPSEKLCSQGTTCARSPRSCRLKSRSER